MYLKIFCDKIDVLNMGILKKLHDFGYKMEIIFVGKKSPTDEFFSFYSRRILGPFVQLCLCDPSNIRLNLSAHSNIAFLSPHYSFKESDIEILNSMNYILTSNPIVKDKLIRHGVEKNVSVKDVQCFYETLAFEKSNMENYTFLFHSEWNESSGWKEMMFSFCNEFCNSNVDLIISTNKNGNIVNSDIDRFLLLNNFKRSDYSGIYVISDKELGDVLRFTDCFVAPYIDNFYDQNVLTVMRCEIPLIINRLDAYQLFCRKNTCWIVDFVTNRCPDTLQMSKIMRKVFENRDEAKEKAKVAKQFLINTFGEENFYEQIFSVISEAGVNPLSNYSMPLNKWGNVI